MGTISKVKGVQGAGHFDGKFGRMFKFDYSMEDGTNLQANHKTEDGFFVVGSEVEYNITRESDQFGKSGKVGKPQDEQYQNNGGGQSPAPAAAPVGRSNSSQSDKNKAFALSYAKDLFVPSAGQYTDGKNLAKDVIEVANEFLTFLNN